MNIDAKRGDKVVYVGCSDEQVSWGNCDDPRLVLVDGYDYEVEATEIHSWHTKVFLRGIRGGFPSTAFEDLE